MDIKFLMGPGVDPHLYKITQKDMKDLIAADIVFYNGLHLEGKMAEILEKMSKTKVITAVSDALQTEDIINDTNFTNAQDPHIWHNALNWIKCSKLVYEHLAKIDKKNKDFYYKNLKKYTTKLQELHVYILQQIETIPEKQRIMITSHDAFSYYGDAYGIQTKGLQGISTLSEFGLKDVVNMVDFITKNNIKAVFTETSISEKSLRAIIEGCKEKGHVLSYRRFFVFRCYGY